jgi:predicted transcriptional regulator
MIVTAKIEAGNIIKSLPDDISFEDIQYHLFVAEKLRKSREQIKEGKVFTQEEVEKRLEKWIIK